MAPSMTHRLRSIASTSDEAIHRLQARRAAARHVHDFTEMLHHLRGDQLPDWMERGLADDLPALHSLVSGLRRDFDAVTAGLSTPWSSGQVEGHVTRVKLIKRMAYGRANLELLRQRVLLDPYPGGLTRSLVEPKYLTAHRPRPGPGCTGQSLGGPSADSGRTPPCGRQTSGDPPDA
ncbi:transposase [Streptomyces sp. NPDC059957]|uniref:transposase n=1 Tax=Streptomyces sp. NPDC059957 TaxID=3347016 RepID=UPI00364DBD64